MLFYCIHHSAIVLILYFSPGGTAPYPRNTASGYSILYLLTEPTFPMSLFITNSTTEGIRVRNGADGVVPPDLA